MHRLVFVALVVAAYVAGLVHGSEMILTAETEDGTEVRDYVHLA